MRGEKAILKPEEKKDTVVAAKTTVDNCWKAAALDVPILAYDWYIDGGCTSHISSQQSYFSKYTAYPSGTNQVNGFNRVQSDVARYGEVTLTSCLPDGQSENIVLQHFMHLPELVNLNAQFTIMDKDVRVKSVTHYKLNLHI
jgi:hypothetical protein